MKIACILLIIFFSAAAVYTWHSTETAKGRTKRDLLARLASTQLPPLAETEALSESRFTQFADEQFPDLGHRWNEVRGEYNKTLSCIHLLESKRADLLTIASWEGSRIDLSTGEPYIKLINHLILKCRLLKEQHSKIELAMQRCYADHAIKKIMNDSDIKESIDSLIKTTESILELTAAQQQ